jgi:hypothetical protein
MKYSNALKNSVLRLIETKNFPIPESDAEVRRFLRHFGADALLAAELMRTLRGAADLGEERILKIKQDGFCESLSDLAIGGKDLLALGMSGKEVGEVLSFLLDAVTDEPSLNTAERLMELVRGRINEER